MGRRTLLAAAILTAMAGNPRQVGSNLSKMVADSLALASMLFQEAARWWPEEFEEFQEDTSDEE